MTLQVPVGSALAMSRPSETTSASGLNLRTSGQGLVQRLEVAGVADVLGQGEVAG